MFNHHPHILQRLAEQQRTERLREAEISRLPVSSGDAPPALTHKLVLLILAALLAAWLIAQAAAV